MFIESFLVFEFLIAVWTADADILHVFHDATDTCVVFCYDLCFIVGFLKVFQAFDLFVRNLSVAFRSFELQAETVVRFVSVRKDQIWLSSCVALPPSLDAFVCGGL